MGMRKIAVLLGAMELFIWRAALALQEPNIDVDINPQSDGGGAWYATWWIWVLIALFIIVIVALTSRSRSTQ
jgi:hypothetical protein